MAIGQVRFTVRAREQEPGLDRFPVDLVDDAKVRHRRALPFAFGADLLDALAGGRVLAQVKAVPDLDPDIEFAAQDAVAALARADHRGRAPDPAAGRGDLVIVEHAGDLDAGEALGVAGEDPAHDGGFLFENGHLAAGGRTIAIDARAGGQTLFGVGVHAALGLGRQVVEIELRHQSLDRHVHQLHAVGAQGGDSDAQIGQALEGAGVVGEVAEKAVLVLDQDEIKGALLGGGHQHVDARPVGHVGARDRRVGIGGRDRPAPRLGVTGAERQLVGDRRRVLLVVAVSGVEGDAHYLTMRSISGVGQGPSTLATACAASVSALASARRTQSRSPPSSSSRQSYMRLQYASALVPRMARAMTSTRMPSLMIDRLTWNPDRSARSAASRMSLVEMVIHAFLGLRSRRHSHGERWRAQGPG
nr:hypothetical protein [Caulobacter vibrioides]